MFETDSTHEGYEEAAVHRYEEATASIPDCFDSVYFRLPGGDHAEALAYLTGVAPLLGEWWEAIDSLDVDIRTTEGLISGEADEYLRNTVDEWFNTRQEVFHALARHVGIRIPQPDGDDQGVVTSNRCLGSFGYRHNSGTSGLTYAEPGDVAEILRRLAEDIEYAEASRIRRLAGANSKSH